MNRRQLKKEINLIIENFADQCLAFEATHPSKSKEVNVLIDDAAELIDDLMEDIAKSSQFKGKEVKVHYAGINKDLVTRLEALESKLAAL